MSDITFNKLYLYDHVRQLLLVNDVFCPMKDNAPMSKKPILAHKGLDNRIIFRALGPDRVPAEISCNQEVYARVVDTSNRMVVLEKLCRIGPAKGLITLELTSADIENIHIGLYNMVLIRTEDFVVGVPNYYVEKPLYTDMNDNVSMELEITEQAFSAPRPSYVYEPADWTTDLNIPTFGPITPSFYTSNIPGGRVLNKIDSVHSFSTYTQNFTGNLEIWGTLEEAPNPYISQSRWFKIFPTSAQQDIEFVGHTGTEAWSFRANFMYLKFRYIPSTAVLDAGVLAKLIVRT